MYGRGLLTRHSFCDRSRDVAMATNFRGEVVEIGLPTFIRRIKSGDDLSTSCRNVMSFASVTPEIMRREWVQHQYRV